MSLFLQLLINGLITGCVYGLLALGFSLIYSSTRIFHFAYAVNYTAGAYFLYAFMIRLELSLGLSIILALLCSTMLGMLMEKLVYLPLHRKEAPMAISIISSLGLNIFLVNLIAMIFGNETKIMRPGIEKTYQIADIIINRIQLYQVIVFVILVTLTLWFLKQNSFGKRIRAMADNPRLLGVLGISVERVRLIVFAIGTFLASAASILVALDVGMDPHVGFNALLAGAVATIIGGIGVYPGAIVGAFLLAISQSMVIWQTSARWEEAVTFVILIIFLFARPQGLLGRNMRLEEQKA